MDQHSHELPVVVGLGPVDAATVSPVLDGVARFVADPSPADLEHAVGAIVRAHVNLDKAMFATLPALRVVARTGVGTERVDLDEARARSIPVVITPGANTEAVAEGALAHLLALTKSLSPLTQLVKTGAFDDRATIPVGDLRDGTLAVLGYGRIGRAVARLAQAFGMNCVAYDPFVTEADIRLAPSMEEALAGATHVSVHLPATEDTTGLINREVIASLEPQTILVNLARGEVLDLDAALWGLETGHLGGLGLDVFPTEPPEHHPVFEHPRVILTPHVMGLTTASTEATFIQAAEGIADVLRGKSPAFQA